MHVERTTPPDRTDSDAGPALIQAGSTARRRELQDLLNRRLYHPIASWLALLLARTPVTPNQISFAGGACVAAAGLAYAAPVWPWSVLAGLLLHMAWHVLDGADGDLARLTGRSCLFGETIDGLSDYGGHVLLYLTLGHVLAQSIGAAGWLAAVSAGLSRVAQTNHYEVQRRLYQWRVYGTSWVGSPGMEEPGTDPKGLRILLAGYLRLADAMAPAAPQTEAALANAACAPERLTALRAMIRLHMRGPLRRLAPLGSNPRTIMLGASMLAGSPLYYFLYELTLLNAVLALSVRRCHCAAVRLEEAVVQLADSSLR